MSWSGKCVSQRPGGMRSPAPLHPALCRGAGEPFQPVLPGQVLTGFVIGTRKKNK